MGKKKDTLGKKGETNTDAAEDNKAEDNEKNKNKSAPNKTTGKKPTVKDPSQNEVKKKNFITRNKIIKRDKMKKETMTIRKPPKETVAVAKENIAETKSKKKISPAERTMMTRNMKKRENMEKVSVPDENNDASDENNDASDASDNTIKHKVQKIVLIDYNEEKLPRTKKGKKDNPYKDMLKPDLIRACKETGLPFIGTRAHFIVALVKEARGSQEDSKELPKEDLLKILPSMDHEDASGSICKEEKLLQKDQKRMEDKVDLLMTRKQLQKRKCSC